MGSVRPRGQLSPKASAKAVEAFNASHSIGDEMEYRSHPEAEPRTVYLATEASLLSGHTAVAWVDGVSGCVAISALRRSAEVAR